MPQKIICVVAGQRAGTTALQRALVRSGAVENFGEIFQDVSERSGANDKTSRAFFDFVRTNDIRLIEVLKKKGANELAHRYIAFLREAAAPKHVLVDVKFNSWLTLSPAWAYPHEEPHFMRHLKKVGTFFVFVWRENLSDQVLSMFISQKLGTWHNIDADKVAGQQFEAPVKWLQQAALLVCRSETAMLEHLQNYKRKIVIAYEDLFQEGKLTSGFISEFGALTGLKVPDEGSKKIRPNDVKKSDIITNYQEADKIIRDVQAVSRSAALRRNTGPAKA